MKLRLCNFKQNKRRQPGLKPSRLKPLKFKKHKPYWRSARHKWVMFLLPLLRADEQQLRPTLLRQRRKTHLQPNPMGIIVRLAESRMKLYSGPCFSFETLLSSPKKVPESFNLFYDHG